MHVFCTTQVRKWNPQECKSVDVVRLCVWFHGELIKHVCVPTGHQAVLCTDCSEACGAETSPEWKPESRGEEEEEVSVFRGGGGETEKERDHQGKEIMLTFKKSLLSPSYSSPDLTSLMVFGLDMVQPVWFAFKKCSRALLFVFSKVEYVSQIWKCVV